MTTRFNGTAAAPASAIWERSNRRLPCLRLDLAGGSCTEFPHEVAAAYLFHLVQNRPFVDGNKRVGLASALKFLRVTRRRLKADKKAVEQLVLGVASGTISKSALAQFFQKHVTP